MKSLTGEIDLCRCFPNFLYGEGDRSRFRFPKFLKNNIRFKPLEMSRKLQVYQTKCFHLSFLLYLSFFLGGERRSLLTGDRLRSSFCRLLGLTERFRGVSERFLGLSDLFRTGLGLVIGGDFKGERLSCRSCLVDGLDGGFTGVGVFFRAF